MEDFVVDEPMRVEVHGVREVGWKLRVAFAIVRAGMWMSGEAYDFRTFKYRRLRIRPANGASLSDQRFTQEDARYERTDEGE